MDYDSAVDYVEAIVVNRKNIKKSIATEKKKREGLRASFYGGAGRLDPTADTGIRNVDEITLLVCLTDEGQTFTVKYPERWLDVINNCFIKYKDSKGVVPWDTIHNRYDKGWSITKITVFCQVSKRTVMFRRKDFLSLVVAYAAQAGLVALD